MASSTTLTCDGCGTQTIDGVGPRKIDSIYLHGKHNHFCTSCWGRAIAAATQQENVAYAEVEAAWTVAREDNAVLRALVSKQEVTISSLHTEIARTEDSLERQQQTVDEHARLERAHVDLSDSRDEIEFLQENLREIVQMLGKKRRKKNAARLASMNLRGASIASVAQEQLVDELRSRAGGPLLSMKEIMRRAQEQQPAFGSKCGCTNGCKSPDCENM